MYVRSLHFQCFISVRYKVVALRFTTQGSLDTSSVRQSWRVHVDWQFLFDFSTISLVLLFLTMLILIIACFKFTEVLGDFNIETLLILDPSVTKTSVRSTALHQLQRVIELKCRSFAKWCPAAHCLSC